MNYPPAETLSRRPAKIAFVVLNYNSAMETLGCLESLRAATQGDFRIWVVDNGSSDGSADTIKAGLGRTETLLTLQENAGYAGGNNVGIRAALIWGANYVLIINPDCRVEPHFLPPLVSAFESQRDVGIVCPLVLDSSTASIQAFGGCHNLWTGSARRRLYHEPVSTLNAIGRQEVSFPHGACMLVRRECFENAGLLSEVFFLYYEDVEFGLRIRRNGWRTIAVAESRVSHTDTTGRRMRDPVVAYYSGRNQIWVERLYADLIQYAVFCGLSALLRWPAHFIGSLFFGGPAVASATVKGHLRGILGSCPRHENKLATAGKE